MLMNDTIDEAAQLRLHELGIKYEMSRGEH